MSSTKRKKVAESEQTIKTPEALLKKNTAADEKKNKAAAVNAKTARPLPKKKSARGSGSPEAVEVAASSPPASSKKRSKNWPQKDLKKIKASRVLKRTLERMLLSKKIKIKSNS